MDDSDDILLFSDYRTDVIGFPSSTSTDHRQHVHHQEIATDPLPSMVDQNVSTNARLDIGVQTTTTANNAHQSTIGALAKCDDTVLAAWLRQIYPIVEKELLLGPTPVSTLYESALWSKPDANLGAIVAHQVIALSMGLANNSQSAELHGCAAWMSVTTQNAPMLALAGSSEHSEWCDHSGATVEIFKPTRKHDGDIFYAPYRTLGVKSCVQTMSTNPHNKDMLAAGCYSGDVCVWLFRRLNNNASVADSVIEVPGDNSSQFGCVVGIAWLGVQNESVEQQLLSAHADGMVVLWKIVTLKSDHNRITREKLFSIKSTRNPKESARISAITVLTVLHGHFAIGTEDGHIYLCSLATNNNTRATNSQTNLTVLDPIVAELCDPHRFAVTTLRALDSVDTLVSADVSGEVHFRSLRNGDLDALIGEPPRKVLRVPIEIPRLSVSRDGRHLMCAGRDGALEVFSVGGQPPRIAIPGKCSGPGHMLCAISDNECWAITGLYDNRSFQLLQVFKQ